MSTSRMVLFVKCRSIFLLAGLSFFFLPRSQPVNSGSYLGVTDMCACGVSLGIGFRFRILVVVCWVPDYELEWVECRGGNMKVVCSSWLWRLVMVAFSAG